MSVNQQERLAYLIETMWKEQYGDKPLGLLTLTQNSGNCIVVWPMFVHLSLSVLST